MSFPSIPNVSVTINLTAEGVVNLLLASIAFEELGLAHLINAEAEKIQFILGTLPGQTGGTVPFGSLISVDEAVERMLKLIAKNQMLLEFKLEETKNISTSSTTTPVPPTTTTTTTQVPPTTTTTTTTTTSTTTTTTTTTTPTGPLCTFAVFANNNFSIASQSVIDANTQVNGDLTLTHDGNTFLGNTNVVGAFSDSGGNTFQNLVLNAPPVTYPTFSIQCLEANATLVLNGDQNIGSQADAAIYQGQTVFVNGNVSITGGGISITGGGIIATGGITVSGGNFTYTSTGCFALYSDSGDIRINNGPYTIKGLIYTSPTGGDIRLATSQGGSVCGALFSGNDIIFTGGSAIHSINNQGGCSICVPCSNNPCLIP